MADYDWTEDTVGADDNAAGKGPQLPCRRGSAEKE